MFVVKCIKYKLYLKLKLYFLNLKIFLSKLNNCPRVNISEWKFIIPKSKNVSYETYNSLAIKTKIKQICVWDDATILFFSFEWVWAFNIHFQYDSR